MVCFFSPRTHREKARNPPEAPQALSFSFQLVCQTSIPITSHPNTGYDRNNDSLAPPAPGAGGRLALRSETQWSGSCWHCLGSTPPSEPQTVPQQIFSSSKTFTNILIQCSNTSFDPFGVRSKCDVSRTGGAATPTGGLRAPTLVNHFVVHSLCLLFSKNIIKPLLVTFD